VSRQTTSRQNWTRPNDRRDKQSRRNRHVTMLWKEVGMLRESCWCRWYGWMLVTLYPLNTAFCLFCHTL